MVNVDCIIGIDPGANGAIVTWRPNAVLTSMNMPEHILSLTEYFQWVKTVAENPLVMIEKVQARPDDMEFKKAVGIQKMLNSFQQLKDVLDIEGIPYIQVHPVSWQTTLNLKTKAENQERVDAKVKNSLATRTKKGKPAPTDKERQEIVDRAIKSVRKDRYKRVAQKYYPEIKATLNNADAILLMHFGRTKLQNEPTWLLQRLPQNQQDKIKF